MSKITPIPRPFPISDADNDALMDGLKAGYEAGHRFTEKDVGDALDELQDLLIHEGLLELIRQRRVLLTIEDGALMYRSKE